MNMKCEVFMKMFKVKFKKVKGAIQSSVEVALDITYC